MGDRTKLFISYSHEDIRWLRAVKEQLAVLEREGLVDVYEDTQLQAGEAWYHRLHSEMSTAKVALLLISAPFLSSGFIRNEEVPKLFDRHAEGGMSIYPLLVRPCPWREVGWLSKLQIRPQDAKRQPKAVSAYSGAARDQVLADVASEIARMVEAERPNQSPSEESRATPPTPPIAATSDAGMQDRITGANPPIPKGARAVGLSSRARAERDEARQRIESYLTQLQNALQRGVVDREAAMTQMKALLTLTQAAAHEAQYEPHELDGIFDRGSEASRIVALALVQVRPTVASLRISLEATSRPRTPWEQYLGLVVLESLVQTLTTPQKQEVERIIRKQQGGRAGDYITPQNEGRWEVATRILRQLKKRSKKRSTGGR